MRVVEFEANVCVCAVRVRASHSEYQKTLVNSAEKKLFVNRVKEMASAVPAH